MKILGIDTVTQACSVAIGVDGDIIQKIEIQSAAHSRLVLSMVESILAECGIVLQTLDAIAIDTGPGSFTGLRIGLGVAQGLAYGVDLPVIGVCSLESLAIDGKPIEEKSSVVLPAIDARINQIYCGLYRVTDNGCPQEINPPIVSDPNAIPFDIPLQTVGIGSGWDNYTDSLNATAAGYKINIIRNRYPQAKDVVRLAMQKGLAVAKSPMLLEATYVRNQVAKPAITNTNNR